MNKNATRCIMGVPKGGSGNKDITNNFWQEYWIKNKKMPRILYKDNPLGPPIVGKWY